MHFQYLQLSRVIGVETVEYHFKNRQEVEDFVRNEVLTTSEAAKLLDVSRQRMSQLISSGKLTPVKNYVEKVCLSVTM